VGRYSFKQIFTVSIALLGANKEGVKNAQALRGGVPMDSSGLRQRVALENDQFGHVSLNLLYFSRTSRGRQVVNMGVWQGKAKRRKGKSHFREKGEP
jgi:hypothetical protein